MGHLSSDALIDRLEAPEAGAPDAHLASCAVCRARLADLRATLAAVADVDVPEPPEAFWPALSARVQAGIAEAPRAGWRRWLTPAAHWWAWPAAAGAVAALVLLVGQVGRVGLVGQVGPVGRVGQVGPVGQVGRVGQVGQVGPVVEPPAVDDDPQMALVVDLATGLDWDDFGEAGLAPRAGWVDRALDDLTDGERVELERLLTEAMRQPGA